VPVVVEAIDALREAVRAADAVAAVGGRTHWEVGGPPPTGAVEVQAPAGVVAYDPAELTVTVGAGTTVAELQDTLGEAGQECVLEPRSAAATVGGVIASGLSGYRRLRYGPVRDRVLEVRMVTADGRVVKGGGPTVKNVSGYDLPRLLVGSLGTIGVITQVILRCQPRPLQATWARTAGDPAEVRRKCFRPSCIAWDGATTLVLLEGHPDDVAAEAAAAGLTVADAPPRWPDGPHRGRISVRPRAVPALAAHLDAIDGLRWLAEIGVGTVHVASDAVDALRDARTAAHGVGGWMLREAGAGDLDGFGAELPNRAVMARLKAAFDPTGKLAPGRLPL
jgi:glycolate oxidase FAD binding subunit